MDHEEMRSAYIRALNLEQTDFTSFCNDCKLTNIPTTGSTVYIQTVLKSTDNKIYKLWYCDVCYDRFSSKINEMELD